MLISMSERDGDQNAPRRRDVLRTTATLGFLSATGQVVGAVPGETSVSVDDTLRHRTVQTLLTEIPDVRLDTDRATVYGDESILVVPANCGRLVTTVPVAARDGQSGGADETVSASFYFDEWISGVDHGWVRGTTARLVAEGDSTTLQRTATTTEKRQFLSELGLTEFDPSETKVVVTPDRGSVRVLHRRTDERVIDWVTATERNDGAIGRRETGIRLQRTDEGAYDCGVSTADLDCETDPESFASNVVYCIWDYSDCGLCAVASVAPPISVACWVIVCLDGGVSVAAEILTDIGCTAAAQDACLDAIIAEYGDSLVTIPTPL